MAEKLKCRYEGIPYEVCPTEKRARKFASKCVARYMEEWEKKVEPVIGEKRILGWEE